MRVPQWPRPPIVHEAVVENIAIHAERQANEYFVGPWEYSLRCTSEVYDYRAGIGSKPQRAIYDLHLSDEMMERLRAYFVRRTLFESITKGELF